MKLCTEALGPYKRMSIWFQGCNLGCKDCCNPELQPFEKRHILSLQDLTRIATDAKDRYGIEGVTLIGGEPTLQQNLNHLAHAFQNLGLGIILFTGKLYSELGVEQFSEKVKFDKHHMTEDVELVLKIGIAGALSSL